MKKPWPSPVFVHTTPVLRLWHRNAPTTAVGVVGERLRGGVEHRVAGAHEMTRRPSRSTINPCPKSTMVGQLWGLGGGDQDRCRTSQRAVPAMIMQPMFPLGDLNVAT